MPTTSGYAGAATTAVYGDNDWSDDFECINAPDGAVAEASTLTFSTTIGETRTYYLVASTFGFAVPAGAAATSIAITARARVTGGAALPRLFAQVQLPDNTISPDAPYFVLTPGAALADYVFGGSDLFGLSQSQFPTSVINDSALRVLLWGYTTQSSPASSNVWKVDSVHLSVTYATGIPDIFTNAPNDFVRPAPKKRFVYC